MVHRWQTKVRVISAILVLSGCASVGPGKQVKAPAYHESAFNDLNYAPDGFAPKDYSELEKASGSPVHERAKADYYFALGDSYSLQGDHQRAIEAFRSVLIFDSNSAPLYLRLATEYLRLGMITESMNYAQRAVETDVTDVESRLLLGGIYSSLRMYDGALEQYKKVIGLDPQNAEAPLYIGALLAEQGRFDEAAKYFKGLLSNENFTAKHLAHYYIGRVRLEQGTPASIKEAESEIRRSLEIKPGFEEAVVSLGHIYKTQNKRKSERQLYAEFQRQHGPNGKIAQELAKIYIEDEDYNLALEQLEIADSIMPSELSVKVQIALLYIERKDYKKAIPKLHDILKVAPESDKIRFYLAAVYQEIQDYRSAIMHYSKVPAGSPFYQEAVIHSVYSHKLLNENSEALALIENAIKARADLAEFYTLYATLLEEGKESAKAHDWLVRASGLFPENPQIHFYLGALRDRLGKQEEMMADMRKVLSLDPDHVQALNYLAYSMAERSESLDEAEKMARKALSFNPEDGYILDTLGWVLFKQGKTNESIKYLEAAYANQPNESIIAEHLGDAYFKSQLMEKAKAMYVQAINVGVDKDKRKEIRAKITAIDKQKDQRANIERAPASASSK